MLLENTINAVITSGERVILESASGSITQITLQDAENMAQDMENELIARAEGDIKLAKQATLYVDTVYSASGDIVLDVRESDGSSANDILGYGEDEATKLKAKNISLIGAQNLGKKVTDDAIVGSTLGIAITESNGKLSSSAIENADLLLNSDLINAEISAKSLTLSNTGKLSGGSFNADSLSLANTGELVGVTISSEGNATITNNGTVSGGTINVGADAHIDNQGTVSGGTINAAGDVDIANKGSVNNNLIMAQNVRISNEGELAAVNVTAAKNIAINSTTDVDIATAVAGAQLTIDSAAAVSAGTLQAHSIDVAADGSVDVQNVTSAADVKMRAGNDITAQSIAGADINLTAGKDIKITSKSSVNALQGVGERGSVPVGATTPKGGIITADGRYRGTDFSKNKGTASISSTSGNITLNAGNTVAIDTLKTNSGHINITANRVGIDDFVNTSNAAASLTISGQNGAAGYVGLTNSSASDLLLQNSQIDELSLYSPDHITLQNLVVTNIANVYTDKVHVQIKDKPNNAYSMLVDKLSINGYDLSTKDIIGRVSNGVTIDGKHSTRTPEKVIERSLFTKEHAGKSVEKALERENTGKGIPTPEQKYVDKGKETIVEFAEKDDSEDYISIK